MLWQILPPTIAQPEAESRKSIGEEIGKKERVDYLVTLKYLESLHNIAEGKAARLFLPTGVSIIIGSR